MKEHEVKERLNNEHQAIVGGWQEKVFGKEVDLYGRLRKFEEEAGEVLEIPPTMGTIDQINNPDAKTARKLAEEVTDTIIAGLGVLDTLGFDFERLFMEKLGIMYDKYNPSEIEHLVANGHSREDAVTIRKQQWQTPPYELLGRTGLEE